MDVLAISALICSWPSQMALYACQVELAAPVKCHGVKISMVGRPGVARLV